MRMLGCVLIAVVALLGLAPTSVAAGNSDSQPPQARVSLLAVSLTAGAAIAAVGSGAFQVAGRRRAAGHDAVGQHSTDLALGVGTADAVIVHPGHRPPSRRSE